MSFNTQKNNVKISTKKCAELFLITRLQEPVQRANYCFASVLLLVDELKFY